jgi:hypothetical protein
MDGEQEQHTRHGGSSRRVLVSRSYRLLMTSSRGATASWGTGSLEEDGRGRPRALPGVGDVGGGREGLAAA